MAIIKSNKIVQIVMENRIDVDGVLVKFQRYTINTQEGDK